MRKRLFSLLTAVCLCFFSLPVRANALEVSGGCGAEQEEALAWKLSYSGGDGFLTFQGSGTMKDYVTLDGDIYPYNGSNYTARYTQAPWYAHRNTITVIDIPSGMTRIGNNAFYGNPNRPAAPDYRFSALVRLTMADSVSSIGDSAFARCTSLKDVHLSAGLETIEDYAFSGCEALESCLIPESVHSIGAGAFSDCPNLTLQVYRGSYGEQYAQVNSLRHAVLGDGGVNIASGNCGADDAESIRWTLRQNGTLEFSGNGSMQDYTLISGESYQVSTGGATYRASYTAAPWYQYKDQIRRVVVSEGVTSIGAYAFCGNIIRNNAPDYRFDNLESVTLAQSVRTVGAFAFARCNGLAECEIPEGLSTVGESAFNGCAVLSGFYVPESVSSIGTNAFANCPALTLTVPLGSYAEQWALSSQTPHRSVGTAKVESVSIEPAQLQMQIGQTALLRAQVLPANARESGVTWQSLNESVIRVDRNGQVTAVGTGSAQILVITVDGQKTAFCSVTVTSIVHPAGVVLSRSRLGLEVGESAVLTASVLPDNASDQTVIWTSSNSSVATVDENGLVTLIAAGEAVISVTTQDGGKTASCIVTSPVAVKGIRMNKTAMVLRPGETGQLSASVLPENATNTDVAWTSSNPAVADVTDTGMVRAYAEGTATLIAISRQGNFTALCLLTVQNYIVNVTDITLNRARIDDLEIGASIPLTAEISPLNATNRSIAWTSSDSSVALVSGNGVVTAAAAGSALITAVTADGGLIASCPVTVFGSEREPDRLTVETHGSITVPKGSPLNLSGVTVRAFYGAASQIVTDYTVSGYRPDTIGRQSVSISYRNKSESLDITVEEVKPVQLVIVRLPDKLEYLTGESLDLTGMELQSRYNDGSSADIAVSGTLPSGVSCSGFRSAMEGIQTVSIEYDGCTASFSVTVRSGSGQSGNVEAPKMSISSYMGGKSVSLSAVSGAEIYYTVDGTSPDASSAHYSEPILLTGTATVKAVAAMNGSVSAATSGRIPVPVTETPSASHPDGAQLPAGTIITLQSDTSGAAIYYTTDGTAPSVNSLRYSSAIPVNASMIVRAVAVKDGFRNSEPISLHYTVPQSQVEKRSDATVSIASVVSRAGEIISAPVYILTEGNEKVTDFRFNMRFDRTMFAYASLTPIEGMMKSSLMVSADVSSGVVAVQYSGTAMESGEMFTLNLNVLASAEDGKYPLDVTDDVMSLKTDAGTPLVSVTSGVIELLGSHNSQLSCSISYQDANQREITSLSGNETDISATFTLDPYTPDTPDADVSAVMADVFLAVYDRKGLMVDLEFWNISLSNIGSVFMRSINIPPNVEVGSIKVMILSEDMTPMMAANVLEPV